MRAERCQLYLISPPELPEGGASIFAKTLTGVLDSGPVACFQLRLKGATDDEIKAAIQIAAEVSRFSILLYGNEFGQDNLKKILKKMTSK